MRHENKFLSTQNLVHKSSISEYSFNAFQFLWQFAGKKELLRDLYLLQVFETLFVVWLCGNTAHSRSTDDWRLHWPEGRTRAGDRRREDEERRGCI